MQTARMIVDRDYIIDRTDENPLMKTASAATCSTSLGPST